MQGKFEFLNGEIIFSVDMEGVVGFTLDYEDNSESSRLEAMWVSLDKGYSLYGENYIHVSVSCVSKIEEVLSDIQSQLERD